MSHPLQYKSHSQRSSSLSDWDVVEDEMSHFSFDTDGSDKVIIFGPQTSVSHAQSDGSLTPPLVSPGLTISDQWSYCSGNSGSDRSESCLSSRESVQGTNSICSQPSWSNNCPNSNLGSNSSVFNSTIKKCSVNFEQPLSTRHAEGGENCPVVILGGTAKASFQKTCKSDFTNSSIGSSVRRSDYFVGDSGSYGRPESEEINELCSHSAILNQNIEVELDKSHYFHKDPWNVENKHLLSAGDSDLSVGPSLPHRDVSKYHYSNNTVSIEKKLLDQIAQLAEQLSSSQKQTKLVFLHNDHVMSVKDFVKNGETNGEVPEETFGGLGNTTCTDHRDEPLEMVHLAVAIAAGSVFIGLARKHMYMGGFGIIGVAIFGGYSIYQCIKLLKKSRHCSDE